MTVIYKSKTGRTIAVQGYIVSADPGAEFEKEIKELEEVVGTLVTKEVVGAAEKAVEPKSSAPKPVVDNSDKTEAVKP